MLRDFGGHFFAGTDEAELQEQRQQERLPRRAAFRLHHRTLGSHRSLGNFCFVACSFLSSALPLIDPDPVVGSQPACALKAPFVPLLIS